MVYHFSAEYICKKWARGDRSFVEITNSDDLLHTAKNKFILGAALIMPNTQSKNNIFLTINHLLCKSVEILNDISYAGNVIHPAAGVSFLKRTTLQALKLMVHKVNAIRLPSQMHLSQGSTVGFLFTVRRHSGKLCWNS